MTEQERYYAALNQERERNAWASVAKDLHGKTEKERKRTTRKVDSLPGFSPVDALQIPTAEEIAERMEKERQAAYMEIAWQYEARRVNEALSRCNSNVPMITIDY